jgi:uncharacterized membrane protein
LFITLQKSAKMDDANALKPDLAHPKPSKSYRRSNKPKILATPLPDPIGKSIEAVVELHSREVQDLSVPLYILENASEFFSRPAFLYVLLTSLAAWILGSALSNIGILSASFPDFSFMNQGLDTAALLISTVVLVRQTRQEKFAEQRSQLMLQLNLLSEKKIAKVITLLEELRVDLPDVVNRIDQEADIMQNAADPVAVLGLLQENLEQEIFNKNLLVDQAVDSKA